MTDVYIVTVGSCCDGDAPHAVFSTEALAQSWIDRQCYMLTRKPKGWLGAVCLPTEGVHIIGCPWWRYDISDSFELDGEV